MQWLRQSTVVTLKIGPFLDDTDGKNSEGGLTIAQTDVRLSKNGGDIAQKTEATSCTHDEFGVYGCPIDATDTATLGRLQLWAHGSGALPVWHEYMVVPANVWDSLFDTDKMQVDVTQCGGNAVAAGAIPNAAADGAGGLPLSDAGGLEMDKIIEDTNEIQGLISGSKIAAQVKGMDADVLTASALATDAGDEIADQVADEAYEGELTLRHMMRILLSVLAGLSNGGGTATIKFRDLGDAKDRVTATVEADGDRTVMTLDGT